jgi:hypothetical protein
MLQDRCVVSDVYDAIAVALREQGIHPDYHGDKGLRFWKRESTEKLCHLLSTVPLEERPRPQAFEAWEGCVYARMLRARRAAAIARLAEAQAAEPPSSLVDLLWQQWRAVEG